MTIKDSIVDFARIVRADRAANPQLAGDGTGLELLLAPRFQTLLEELLTFIVPADPPSVLPEYRRRGIGRPDIAFVRRGSLARAFIELKEPNNTLDTGRNRGHDADQFRRFSELPLWGYSNFTILRLYRRGQLVDFAEILPHAAIEPETSASAAARMIEAIDHGPLERILLALAMAQPPAVTNAAEIADALGHAARLVREIVVAQCAIGLDEAVSNVRADFNETLFARAEAGGYDPSDSNSLFASAFAQTLVFGLLLAREARGTDVGTDAYEYLTTATYPLLRGTLRALTLDEVRAMLGVAFDVTLDAVNSVDPTLLETRDGRDPLLYLYEDFLRVFDPSAVARYGVYYTPPEIVQLIVAETDRAIRTGLGADGLLDPSVNLLDPACGTGTFLIAAASSVARDVAHRYGTASVAEEVSAFARRMHGFELLVGPYTVAHYRMLREVARHGGTVGRLPIYLTDTLAPPAGATGVEPHLAFLSAPMVDERRHSDEVKRNSPILAILGNPPYKRLRSGEVERLVGADMSLRWEDLKRPVRDAGFGLSLNAFPDLYVAFYRWALWRLFESEAALGRGVLSFITNRGFLTGMGFGGLRQMLRQRFDHIRIIDLRGDSSGARPATVPTDENVFNIKVGVCVLVAYASGNKPQGQEATVEYADVWAQGAFDRREKLALAVAASSDPARLNYRSVNGTGMDRLKPPGFDTTDWPGIPELFTYRSNGLVTYRDEFVYATSYQLLSERIEGWHQLSLASAREAFGESALNRIGPARSTQFDPATIEQISYRPLDRRFLYNRTQFVDRRRPDLISKWGTSNFAFISLGGGTGVGPAVWCHGLKPDQHSFRGSYGGWVFLLRNHAAEGLGHFFAPQLIPGLSAAYGFEVTPQQVFDAILTLLSASSYTVRFAHDLEDDFPHIPFPANPADFSDAARLGERIRLIETFTADPADAFRNAILDGTNANAVLDVPTPKKAFSSDGTTGYVALVSDRSLRIANVSARAWSFSVSGHGVIYKWLRARNGERITAALQRSILDIVWRVEELLHLFEESDVILARSLEGPLKRRQLGLAVQAPLVAVSEETA